MMNNNKRNFSEFNVDNYITPHARNLFASTGRSVHPRLLGLYRSINTDDATHSSFSLNILDNFKENREVIDLTGDDNNVEVIDLTNDVGILTGRVVAVQRDDMSVVSAVTLSMCLRSPTPSTIFDDMSESSVYESSVSESSESESSESDDSLVSVSLSSESSITVGGVEAGTQLSIDNSRDTTHVEGIHSPNNMYASSESTLGEEKDLFDVLMTIDEKALEELDNFFCNL